MDMESLQHIEGIFLKWLDDNHQGLKKGGTSKSEFARTSQQSPERERLSSQFQCSNPREEVNAQL